MAMPNTKTGSIRATITATAPDSPVRMRVSVLRNIERSPSIRPLEVMSPIPCRMCATL